MNSDYIFLTEKEEMWAKMFLEILKDNEIPYAVLPVHGAGLVLRSGMVERLQIFVPAQNQEQANELLQEVFQDEGGSK